VDVTRPCCAPRAAATLERETSRARKRRTNGQVLVPGGTFAMGDAFGEGYPDDGERPVHTVRLRPFLIDVSTVTKAQFAAFVADTGYVTDAERAGASAVFHLHVDPGAEVLGAVAATPWWLSVRGACWRSGADDGHPVTHVSWHDADAYAAWAGKRLPTEAEWERAARGGLEGRRYPWGDELRPCAIWEGDFPHGGRGGTVRADAFEPNGFGLHNTVGNVWEWCADRFSATYYGRSPIDDPRGPEIGDERVLRGGSFLCHDSYCNRYRVAARTGNTPGSSAANVGFRCANDA
jgi:formylglycine-generating enzyme required for sulfatase activity